MKADPTKKIRKRASDASRKRPGKTVFIDQIDNSYNLAGRANDSTILAYKNGSEIAL